MSHSRSDRLPFGFVSFRLLAVCCSFILICGLDVLSARGVNRTDSSAIPTVVVRGTELSSACGASPGFSPSQFSAITTSYVFRDDCAVAATIFEGHFSRQGKVDREAELALPHRFGLSIELGFEDFDDDDFQSETQSLEAGYALADSNEIPLNPPLLIEYKFGRGGILRGDGMQKVEEEPPELSVLRQGLTGRIRHSDEIEGRLLLAQEFGARVERAKNGFIGQETPGDRRREWVSTQSIVTSPTREERLKAGVEMQSTNSAKRDARNDPKYSFVIGPSIAGKPNRWSRLTASAVFAGFSILFDGATRRETGGAPFPRNLLSPAHA